MDFLVLIERCLEIPALSCFPVRRFVGYDDTVFKTCGYAEV